MKKSLALLFVLTAACLHAIPMILENDAARITLEDSKNFLLTSLLYKKTGTEYMAGGILSEKHIPWQITLRHTSGVVETLTPLSPCASVHAIQGEDLKVVWKGINGKIIKGDITFEMTVSLRPDGASVWSCKVHGTANGQLWEVDFPRILGLTELGDDFLASPLYIGRLFKDPASNRITHSINYPQPGSMQFLAYWGTKDKRSIVKQEIEDGWTPSRSDANGLIYHMEDPEGYHKQFHADMAAVPGHVGFRTTNIPSVDKWPVKDGDSFSFNYSLPYNIVLKPFTGDVYTAAKIYRDWAVKQKWCSAGIIPSSKNIPANPDELARWKPAWFREAGFWAKYYHEPYKILPEWANVQDWLRVPIASHYYRYNIASFDDNYPEHLPGDSYLLNGMRAAKRMNIFPQPYINGVIWDTDTQSWIKENGINSVTQNAQGSYAIWDINKEHFAYMCPATVQWQKKMQETAQKQIWEHEMSGVYLDCLAATRSFPCYNPKHGHSLRGGFYQGQGNRKLLYDLRKHIRQYDPQACFFTEEIGEQYLDCMDGFLTLDYIRSHRSKGEQVFPLFNIVYNQYVINFGSDAELNMDSAAYALQMGRLHVSGSVPLHSANPAKPDIPPGPNAELMKDMAQSYYTVGRALTLDAELMDISQRPAGSTLKASSLDVQSEPYQLTYEGDIRKQDVTWAGPSVLAGAFRKEDTITILLVNVSMKDQKITLTATDKLFDGKEAETARIIWPETQSINTAGSTEIHIPASKTAIVTFHARRNAPLPEKLPLLKKDWKYLSAKKNGPFETVPLTDAKTLMACDDAAVSCTFGDKPAAQMLVLDDKGNIAPRIAIIPPGVGGKFEYKTMPRQRAGQPFALLHDIPFAISGTDKAIVIQGDKALLSCAIFGKNPPELVTEKTGVFTYMVIDKDGKPVTGYASKAKALNKAMAKAAKGAGDFKAIIGYADLDDAVITEALRVSRIFSINTGNLENAWKNASKKPTEANLAALSRALRAWFRASSPCPALFTPKGAGAEIVFRFSAIALPFAAQPPAEPIPLDDWISPGIPKAIPTASPDWLGIGSTTKPAAKIEILGNWTKAPVLEDSITITDFNYVEKLIPVLVWSEYPNGLSIPRMTWLECNRPYELQTQPEAISALAGCSADGKVTFRNWSTVNVKVTPKATLPEGWKAEFIPPAVDVPPATYVTAILRVTMPDNAASGQYTTNITANHLSDPEGATFGSIIISAMEKLVPAGKPSTLPKHEEGLRLRDFNSYAIYLNKGETAKLHLENRRVTTYTNNLSWRLLSPVTKEIQKGNIPVDKTKDVSFTATETGAYFLECSPGSGSSVVSSSTHPLSEGTTKPKGLNLFKSTLNRFFYVKKGAKEFQFSIQDGGTDEPAKVTITSPAGRKAFERNGNWAAAPVTVKVLPGEDGKPWNINIVPVQDITLWLEQNTSPWLSDKPEHVLRGLE